MKKEDFEILCHTLGLTDIFMSDSFRNYFVAGEDHADMPKIKRLIDDGYMMQTRRPPHCPKEDKCYMVTEKGYHYVIQNRERPTRAKKRYNTYLSIADVYDGLTFKEFLTHPEFAEYR